MYTVLHIEQSDFFCKMIKNILKEKNYEYISTDSFNEAHTLMDKYKIDLIITSLYGKGGDVEDFIKSVNSKTSNEIPIFIVTSDNNYEKKTNLFNLGIVDYLLKDNLKEEITKHIDAVFQDDEYMANLREAKIAIIEDNSFDSIIEKDILNKRIYTLNKKIRQMLKEFKK